MRRFLTEKEKQRQTTPLVVKASILLTEKRGALECFRYACNNAFGEEVMTYSILQQRLKVVYKQWCKKEKKIWQLGDPKGNYTQTVIADCFRNDLKFEMIRQDKQKAADKRHAYLMENLEMAIICCLQLPHPKPTELKPFYNHSVCFKMGSFYDSQEKQPIPFSEFKFISNIYAMPSFLPILSHRLFVFG